MNYGLYLSASGALTSLHRQDVMANNLANANTVGFKADMVHFRARLAERLESSDLSALIDPQEMLEQLGGGTFAEPSFINLRQSDLAQTKNDLDTAIEGRGFFVVRKTGAGGTTDVRLTRDGRFTRNPAGELIMAGTGMRVLDVNDQPIHLDGIGPVRIEVDGTVYQSNQPIAQLQIASVSDPVLLRKEGANLLKLNGAKRQAADATVRQGFVESSGVDPIITMNQMINASKAVQANITMMQYHDNILGQTVNTFGRVA
jgi:flagellar basal-body rod protein FlgF